MTSASILTAQQRADEADCIRLCVDFANHIDARRYADFVALFTEDGVLDRMGHVAGGQAAIAAFLEGRPAGMVTRHLCTNFRITFAGADEATGVCYALFFQGAPGEAGAPATLAAPPPVVEYHDRYRRTPQGWRIAERRVVMAMKPMPQAGN